MAAEQFTIDSTLCDSTNTQIVLDDGTNGIRLVSHNYPDPGQNYMGASSADTEGSIPVQNQAQDRTIVAVARCFGASNMRARVKQLQQKAGKLNREQGSITRTLSDGTVIHFDVLSVKCDVPADWVFANKTDVMVTLEFLCRPDGYGAEVTVSPVTETTLPCVSYVVTGVKGDIPALGRLVVTEAGTAGQRVVRYGLESRYYGGTAAAYDLYLEAESRLKYGGAVASAVSGASGGTIVSGTVGTNYQALCATTTSGTAYCAHIGDYRVRARVYCAANAGTVSYAFQWGVGDLRTFTVNDSATYLPTSAATFRDIDLGMVHLPKVAKGTQRWEGRVLGKSTTAGDIPGVDGIYLFPAAEGFGEASGGYQIEQPTTFVARDAFDQSVGSLTGESLPVGGTWVAVAGDTNDFDVEASEHVARRSIASDSGAGVVIGRGAIAGTTTFTNCVAQVDFKTSDANITGVGQRVFQGLLLRYTDTSNFVRVVYYEHGDGSSVNTSGVTVESVVGGVSTTVLNGTIGCLTSNTYYSLRGSVDSAGRIFVWLYLPNTTPGSPLAVYSSSVATGGALASGKAGIYDQKDGDGPNTRNYDNFYAFTPTYSPASDAAVFSLQQLEIRHNTAIRLDSSGTVWSPVSSYEGDYLKIPPAGAEGRSARLLVKGLRNDADSADTAIDDLTTQLYYTPRWLTVPEP